jgi:hypothetical protein
MRDTRVKNKWSAVAAYPAEIKYSIDFYIAEVMDNIHTQCLRIIKEANETTEHSRNFKRKDGCSLSKHGFTFS